MGKTFGFTTFTCKALLLASIVLYSMPAWAIQGQRSTTVHAIGSGTIQGDDLPAGRNKAIDASLVSAVTQVMTEIAPPELVVGNFQVINESILTRKDQFILGYKMLTESTHAKEHRVLVRATVSVQRIKQALKKVGVHVGGKAYPRVLICLAEKPMGQAEFHYWWGQQIWPAGTATKTMTGLFEKKGVLMINPTVDPRRTAYSPQLSVSEAVALGREAKADVVVVGEAVEASAGGNGAAGSANIIVRAYLVASGEEIGQARQVALAPDTGLSTDGGSAMENAASQAGELLASQIVAAWFSKKGSGASLVELRIEGVSGNIANFVKLRGALSNMSGVDSVQRKEMNSDAAVLLVDYQGNIRALADAMARQQFDSFMLMISEPQERTLQVEIVPR